MSSLSREDLKTILLFGIHIAKIDGDFAVWEKKVLARFAEAMQLTDAEKSAMVNQKLSLSEGLGTMNTQDSKQLLLKTLCAVSHSDGVPHDTELDFIQKVMQRLGGSLFILGKDEWGSYEQEVLDAITEFVRSGA